jgi:GNAT superfamily N-acetyltransferase
MCDEWMPGIELALTWEQFHQLPRNPAYKYEFLDGRAYLTPRPKHFHAVLDLDGLEGPALERPEEAVRLRPVRAADRPEMPEVFAAAFHRVQPFGSLDEAGQEKAARQCLERTWTGGDGPLIERASFVAAAEEDGHLVGAALVTLLPEGDPSDADSYYWAAAPPPDCVTLRLGRPHLTWIFVSPFYTLHGVGSALLAAAVLELRQMGYTHLFSTFLFGNDSSLLWHWRNGFRLLPYPYSLRRMRLRFDPGKSV